MKEYPCFCGMCGRDHNYLMHPDEYRDLAGLSGAIRADGRLSLACDECSPLKLSVKKESA